MTPIALSHHSKRLLHRRSISWDQYCQMFLFLPQVICFSNCTLHLQYSLLLPMCAQDKDRNQSAKLSGTSRDVEQNVDNSEVQLDKAFLINIPGEIQVSPLAFVPMISTAFDIIIAVSAATGGRPGHDRGRPINTAAAKVHRRRRSVLISLTHSSPAQPCRA